MKKIIAIYNAPQECGCPFITFINAEDGQVIESVELKYEDLFYEAGVERVVRYQATRSERVCEVVEWKYLDHNKDEYILKMTELGFDMTGWCYYRRRKTDYMDFLKAIIKTYNKDWEILNLIRI